MYSKTFALVSRYAVIYCICIVQHLFSSQALEKIKLQPGGGIIRKLINKQLRHNLKFPHFLFLVTICKVGPFRGMYTQQIAFKTKSMSIYLFETSYLEKTFL